MNYNGARPKEKSSTSVKSTSYLERHKKENKRLPEDDSNIFCRLPFRLYDVLDRVGASAEFRKLHQDCYISAEIIMTIVMQLTQGPLKISAFYTFGSMTEGTTIPSLNSDRDMLQCFNTPVVVNISEARYIHPVLPLLMIREEHTPPGYVKLQCFGNGQPLTVHTAFIDQDYEEYDSEGKLCVTHRSRLGKCVCVHERNGPADTNNEINYDNVWAYRCSTTPEFASEWIRRRRQYKWPTKRMVDKMAGMGCFVVGVGHPDSKERNLEWRLSFSLQERELLFSMNMVQHKCYVILKIIKKDLIEPIVGKSISSYHLKTCMFHAIENTMLSFWKRRNLVHCVLLCMHILFNWVYKGYCPNYFITEENMFDRDIHRFQRLKLLQRIRFLFSNGCDFLFLIKLDNIGVLLKNGTRDVKKESNLAKTRLHEKLMLIGVANKHRKVLCSQVNAYSNCIDVISIILKYVSQTKSIKDHNEHQTQMAFSFITRFFQLQFTQSYASLSFNTYNGEDKCELLQKYGYHLREGRHFDLTSVKLLEATVYLKLEQYERCIGILDRLELVFNENTLQRCSCHDIHVNHIFKEHVRQLSDLPVSQFFEKISTCMIFLRSDVSVISEALQYEMFRSINTPPESRERTVDVFDMAVVDAKVYLHFMQYLANVKLNRRIHKHVAINKLELVLKNDINLGHRETGYNLLGWIHFHENWIQLGIKYFQKSWAIRPHHNAAKLHMLKLIKYINYQM